MNKGELVTIRTAASRFLSSLRENSICVIIDVVKHQKRKEVYFVKPINAVDDNKTYGPFFKFEIKRLSEEEKENE